MSKYWSRKFIVAMAALGSANVLVWFGHISDGVYSAVVIAVVGGFMTANVVQKATASKESS